MRKDSSLSVGQDSNQTWILSMISSIVPDSLRLTDDLLVHRRWIPGATRFSLSFQNGTSAQSCKFRGKPIHEFQVDDFGWSQMSNRDTAQ